jgi:hypothetical protein
MATTAVEEAEDKDKEELNDEVEEEQKDQTTKNTKQGKGLMTIEERATASLGWGVYRAYLKAAGGYWVAPIVLVTLVSTQCANIATSLWLSFWTSNKFNMSNGEYVSLIACCQVHY